MISMHAHHLWAVTRLVIYYFLSHAINNTANQRVRNLLHVLYNVMGGINFPKKIMAMLIVASIFPLKTETKEKAKTWNLKKTWKTAELLKALCYLTNFNSLDLLLPTHRCYSLQSVALKMLDTDKKPTFLASKIAAGQTSVKYNTHLPPSLSSKLFL